MNILGDTMWKDTIKKKENRGPLGAGKYFGGNEMPTLMELDAIVKDKLDKETYNELKDFINELMFAYEKVIRDKKNSE